GEAQRHLEGGSAGVEAAHRPAAAVARERRLERLDLRPRGDPARAQHVADAGDGGLVDIRPREGKEVRHRAMIPIPAQGFFTIAYCTPRAITCIGMPSLAGSVSTASTGTNAQACGAARQAAAKLPRSRTNFCGSQP